MPRKKNPNGSGSIRKKLINGKTYFEARYTDPLTHKQRSVSATTMTECQRKLREIQAGITRGDYVAPQKLTVAAWLTRWLDSREGIEPTTHALYERTIRLYLVPLLGDIQLQSLRRVNCQEFVSALAHDTKRDKPLSAKTIHNAVGVLGKSLDDAVKSGLIAVNPASGLDMPRVEKRRPAVMESAEQQQFLDAIKASPHRAIFIVGLHTGMRISEILGLQWKNINLKTGEVLIEQQLNRKASNNLARELKSTKTHKSRTIFVPPFVLNTLKAVNLQQKESRLKAGPLWANTEGLVFTREDGSPVPHNTIANAFKRLAVKMGRPDLSFHSLRHTFITDEISAGVDVKTVSDMVGHSDARMTLNVYADATREMKVAAAEQRQKRHEAKNA